MKPLIIKTPEGLYVCEIPIENEPEDNATDVEWWIWAATGVGSSPVEAYNNWVKDWELAKAHGVPCFNLYNEDDKQRLIKFVESE